MIKKITMFILMILFFSAISVGQMASLENKAAFPNTTTSVALNVENISNINALTFLISYDPDVLDFIGLSNQALSGMTANASGSVIIIAWYSPVPSSPAGMLCKLNFLFKGTSCPLSFLPGSEVSQGTTPILIGFQNGSVSAQCMPGMAVADLGDAVCATDDFISIPVNLSGFPDVAAYTQKISYDPEKLTFVSITTGGNLNGAISNNIDGLVTITWTFPGGKNINTLPASSNILKLNFVAAFPGNSVIEFAPGCEFTSATLPGENILVCYSGGTTSQTTTLQTASLGSLSGVVQGSVIEVPLTLNLTEPIAAFTLTMNFSTPVLSFAGITVIDPLSATVIANHSGDNVVLAYENLAAPSISSGVFLMLKFTYNGVGSGFVNFVGESNFTNNILMPVNVAFSNATVVPGVFPLNPTVSIGTEQVGFNQVVQVPVEINGSASNPLGAATMFIGYDISQLSFLGVEDNDYGAVVNNLGDQIGIAWSDANGVNLNGNFLKLKFLYHGSGGFSCGTDVYFKNDNLTLQACELGSSNGLYVPANWIDGGVNLNIPPPTINGAANPLANSTESYSTEAGMLNYSWTVVGGTISSGAGTNSVSVLWGNAGNGSVAVSYHSIGGCPLESLKPVVILAGPAITTIQGYITYDNLLAQGVNGVNVALVNSIGNQIGNTVTYSNNGPGFYMFQDVPQDSYTLDVSTTAQWAGVPFISATDALLDELHTAGILNPQLTGIRFMAANVNGGATVNATDALFIKKRIIGEINSFVAEDWVFDNGVVSAFNNPVTTYNFKTLCSGDVNGSYSPVGGFKNQTHVNINEEGLLSVKVGQPFSYSIKGEHIGKIGAVTMYLTYDSELFDIKEISSSLSGMMTSNQQGTITLVWTDPAGQSISNEDEILTVQLVLKKELLTPQSIFKVNSSTEFADESGQIISDFRMKSARIVSLTDNIEVVVMPNPVTSSSYVHVAFPTDGHVKVEVTNPVGRTIGVLADKPVSSGTHSFRFDALSLNIPAGVYFVKVDFGNSENRYSIVRKILFVK